MQRVQTREQPAERISWARALIFGVGFFFISALLVGQLPGYIFNQVTSSTLQGMEQGSLSLGLTCLLCFAIVQVIVLLFDPKPIISPVVFAGLGVIFFVAGLALLFYLTLNTQGTSNLQYWPLVGASWNPLLGGSVLWFQPGAVDLVAIAAIIMGFGAACLFYSLLAIREMANPDRSDPGTTRTIRILIVVATVLLLLYIFFSTFVDAAALAAKINPQCATAITKTCTGPLTGLFIVNLIQATALAIAIFCILGAFALRLHFLMRPVRKRTMSGLYAVGVNLAPFGAIFILAWFLLYPALGWIHSWTFIGLGDFLTVCARKSAIPASCTFSQQAGYIIDTALTSAFFTAFLAAIWAWKTKRNLVIIGSLVVAGVLAIATLTIHLNPDQAMVAFVLSGASLVMVTIWTSVARREFAVVGEKNLGCLGMWLVVGTCLTTYLASFALFSMPNFANETEPNIPFVSGLLLSGGAKAAPDAVATFVVMALLAGLQYFFLVRNRYKV